MDDNSLDLARATTIAEIKEIQDLIVEAFADVVSEETIRAYLDGIYKALAVSKDLDPTGIITEEIIEDLYLMNLVSLAAGGEVTAEKLVEYQQALFK